MMALLYICTIILLFSASIFVHELGHYLAARALGFVVDTFSIGMGPAIWKRRVGETTWQIGGIPFGGFVALPQMDPNAFLETTHNDKNRELPRLPPWKKIVVAVAGATGNIIFAFLLAVVVWLVGKPSSLQEQNAIIGYVATNSPALNLGVAPGDEILTIHQRPVRNWNDILESVALAPEGNIIADVRAADQTVRTLELATRKHPLGVRTLDGIEGMDPCLVAAVMPGSGAEAAQLQAGDQILQVNGLRVFSRGHLSQLVEEFSPQPMQLTVLRAGKNIQATVSAHYDAELKRNLIGIQFNTLSDLDFTTRAHPTPWEQIRAHATALFSFLRALSRPSTSGAAAGAVGGPVMILYMLWLMLKASFILGVWFTGLLNVQLAIINLLPIPILDGGHVVMNLWEWVTRRPAPARLVHALANLFALLFITLFVVLVFRDSARFIAPIFRP